MPYFYVPYCLRSTELEGGGTEFLRQHDVVIVTSVRDPFAVVVYHRSTTDDLSPAHVAQYLIGVDHQVWTTVQADSIETVVETFYADMDPAERALPEERRSYWIDRERPIIELPPCDRLHTNPAGAYTCGEVRQDGNGEWGMCVLESYDPPPDCPICPVLQQVHILPTRRTEDGYLTAPLGIERTADEAAAAISTIAQWPRVEGGFACRRCGSCDVHKHTAYGNEWGCADCGNVSFGPSIGFEQVTP